MLRRLLIQAVTLIVIDIHKYSIMSRPSRAGSFLSYAEELFGVGHKEHGEQGSKEDEGKGGKSGKEDEGVQEEKSSSQQEREQERGEEEGDGEAREGLLPEGSRSEEPVASDEGSSASQSRPHMRTPGTLSSAMVSLAQSLISPSSSLLSATAATMTSIPASVASFKSMALPSSGRERRHEASPTDDTKATSDQSASDFSQRDRERLLGIALYQVVCVCAHFFCLSDSLSLSLSRSSF